MLQNMTEGAPLKLIIPFMVPLLIGNVFQQLYNIADIIIVGRTIGVNALAAVGAVSPLFMLTMVLTIGLSNGFTVVTGQRYGAQDMQGMRRSIATCVVLSIFFVFLIMGIMHLVIDPMLVMMNIPPELMEDAYSYVMIIVDGLLAMMAYNLLSGIMRSLGDSKNAAVLSHYFFDSEYYFSACFHHQLWLGRAGQRLCFGYCPGLFRSVVRNLYLQALSAAAYSSQRLSIRLAGAVGASAYGLADGSAVLMFGTWYYYSAVSLQ